MRRQLLCAKKGLRVASLGRFRLAIVFSWGFQLLLLQLLVCLVVRTVLNLWVVAVARAAVKLALQSGG
jgi:hypothetical protein